MIRRQRIRWLGSHGFVDTLVDREDHSEGFAIGNVILVCPICFAVWAELTWETSLGAPAAHSPQAVGCEDCEWTHELLHPVFGTLIDNAKPSSGVDWALLEALPAELLVREFKLTLASLDPLNEEEPLCTSTM